ncbi:hypothetical protein WN943_004150 [Citrus x changshan-huyou]
MSEKYSQLQDLPEEIIYQILIKTPAKYLYNKVRYWGKSWQNLISSSDFIYQNIQHNKPELLISNQLLGWEEVHFDECFREASKHDYDLVETGGKLALLLKVSETQIGVWISEDFDGQNWIKRQSQ